MTDLTAGEVAAIAGCSIRTLRYYRTMGLLPAPERHGRIACYQQDHLDRLRLIARLQDKGLSLAAIADLFERTRYGTAADWLDLGEIVDRPWTDDGPRLLAEADLGEILDDIDDPPSTRKVLEREGIIQRRNGTPADGWLVPSPALLDITLSWVRLGVEVEIVIELGAILRRHLGSMTDEVVDFFTTAISRQMLETRGPGALASLLEQSRGLSDRSIRVLAAQEMLRSSRAAARPGIDRPAAQTG